MEKFRIGFSGYNKNDVNKFVNEVVDEYEKILDKLRASNQEIEYLNKELAKYKNLERTLNDTLLVAQESSSNAKKAAAAEGRLIIQDAKNHASKIINNSLIKAQNIEREAEDLKHRVNSYKNKFLSLIESQMDEVNSFDDKL